MSSHKLKKLALYVLQAFLCVGAIYMGMAILGGILYLHEASKIDYADMRPEIFDILKTESILVGLGTLLLFWVGSVRTYLARNGKAERRRTDDQQASLKFPYRFTQCVHLFARKEHP